MKVNPFKEIETHQEIPAGIKEKVMKDIDTYKLLADFGELFTSTYASVIKDFWKEDKK